MLVLKGGKGFTLIELLVVIAIIALIGGITVPFMLSQQSPGAAADENARGFYFALQSQLAELRDDGVKPPDIFRINLNPNGNPPQINIIPDNNSHKEFYESISGMLLNKMDKFIANNGNGGEYIAFVDNAMRVTRAYWVSEGSESVTDILGMCNHNQGAEYADSPHEIIPNHIVKGTGVIAGTYPYMT